MDETPKLFDGCMLVILNPFGKSVGISTFEKRPELWRGMIQGREGKDRNRALGADGLKCDRDLVTNQHLSQNFPLSLCLIEILHYLWDYVSKVLTFENKNKSYFILYSSHLLDKILSLDKINLFFLFSFNRIFRIFVHNYYKPTEDAVYDKYKYHASGGMDGGL